MIKDTVMALKGLQMETNILDSTKREKFMDKASIGGSTAWNTKVNSGKEWNMAMVCGKAFKTKSM